MIHEDDDIQFLGGEDISKSASAGPRRSGWRRPWVVAAAVVAVLFVAMGCYMWWRMERWAVSFDYPVSRTATEVIADLEPTKSDTVHGVALTLDSINNVPMRLYELRGLVPTLSREMPDAKDSTIYLAVHAWDYYWDNRKQYHYLGDFVQDGNEIASATNRAGYVAIVGQRWQMGISVGDTLRNYVVEHGGSMFRQFALVSAGQICLKQFALKGKVTRCALARKPGSDRVWYVETVHRESLYDFAEALSDYGFLDAIYLTGGNDGTTFYRDTAGQPHGQLHFNEPPLNVMVFRKGASLNKEYLETR